MNCSRFEGLDALRILSSFGVVFLHVYVAAGAPNSLDLLIKLRDFALPVMVLSSFFLLTRSLARRRETGFARFFRRRVERLWIPLFVWTFVYCLAATFVFPLLSGAETRAEFPSSLVFLTGYRHLWFLQFVFVASTLIYIFFYNLSGWQTARKNSAVLCFAAVAVYAPLYYTFLRDRAVWENFATEADISFGIFISQASYYVLYIPIAAAAALYDDKIRELFARAFFRRLSLIFVFAAAAAHIGIETAQQTREIFGVAVFFAALQPWRKIPFRFAQTLASYSYGIYILHFLPAQMLAILIARNYFEPGAANVLIFSVAIYFASFAAAFSLRKFFKADWLLPLAGSDSEKFRRDFPRPVFPAVFGNLSYSRDTRKHR
jgi:peptidoglycan/LPS O-acetylase OafA/YrhL